MIIQWTAGKRSHVDAEGANLEQANPDETLRQKDPAPNKLWKIPLQDNIPRGIPTV
jgi:hypothetical protein